MKALTIQQPWASLILGTAPPYACDFGVPVGPKDVENRSWGTNYRGDLLVHAGRRHDREGMEMYFDPSVYDQFPTGAVLGLVRLVDVLPPEKPCRSPWAVEEAYHWKLSFPRPFAASYPLRGQLGLFDVPEDGALRGAIESAEIAVRKFWYGLPEATREAMVERAAISEDGGLSRAEANQLAIAEAFRLGMLGELRSLKGEV